MARGGCVFGRGVWEGPDCTNCGIVRVFGIWYLGSIGLGSEMIWQEEDGGGLGVVYVFGGKGGGLKGRS